MKHLKPYKIYESDNICNTCKGTGEVDKEINMFGDMGRYECDDCDGTGKSSRQTFNSDLESFKSESESEIKYLFDKYEIKHGYISSDTERYSDNHEDVEKIEIKSQIYSTSTLSKEFLEEINKMYVDYKLDFNTYNHLYLTVSKPY
jgi:DnaJ-class molecular chaperone